MLLVGGQTTCGACVRQQRKAVHVSAVSRSRQHFDSSVGRTRSILARAAATQDAPPSSLHPRKAVQGVPVRDRETVELIMALTSLDTKPSDALTNQLAEHELSLITTSATCDSMFASVMDSASEDYSTSGDGMASPLADIQAAAEQLAAEVRGSSISSDWNPTSSPKGRSFSSPPGSSHALEQLMAQSEYKALNSTNSKEATSVMARVHALQQQIKAVASKAAAATSKAATSKQAGQDGAWSSAAASAVPNGVQSKTPSQQTGRPSTQGLQREPTLQRAQPPVTMSFDEDCCGDAAAMPVIPGVLNPAAAMSDLAFGRRAAGKAASAPSYPVYKDPASSWLVADSADSKLRIVIIQAPAQLAASVAGTRASSDLTTFETYNLGAKINKSLYMEANALYNRFMPLLLDHLEESGPSGRVMLCGAGLGGSLAALLLLMFVARGMRQSAFAPVYTLNAPAVLCEVPDFKQWCSKDGCSLQDMDGMLEDLLHRGILSQLGLSLDAVRNIYHNQGAAEAAVRTVESKLSPLQAVAASSSKQISSMVQYLDVAALQASPYVPDMLKSWLQSEASGANAGLQRLHILNPVGKMMLYVSSSGHTSSGGLGGGAEQVYSRFVGSSSGLSAAYSNGKH